jgi:hypothetical protein
MVQSPENSSFAASSVRLISAGGNTSWAVTATAKSNESEQAGFRIRFSGLDPDLIRSVDPDPDSGGQNDPQRYTKYLEISCFEVLDVLF